MSDKELDTLITNIQKAHPEQKQKLLGDLQSELLTWTDIACDECDFGTGIELGWDIICHGVEDLNNTAARFLSSNFRPTQMGCFCKNSRGCPLELDSSRAWFADVWNYSLAPYLREAAREGLQLYGRRAPWTDPCQFILDTYPWPGAAPQGLTTITSKDVGLESDPSTQTENDGDPLLNMLMRLQEAANSSSPHSKDSDCNSLDSNLAHGSNIEAEGVS